MVFIISLNGKWKVYDLENEFNFIGNVPGTVHGDLVEQGFLPHPYVGLNEKEFKRLEEKTWVYEKSFFVEKLEKKDYFLVFEGIDTISEIFLNNVYLGKTENMFLTYRYDVSHLLKEGENKIKVIIYSATQHAKRLEQIYGQLHATEFPPRVYIRKAQYSFGWDWGARIVTSGIYRDVYIEELVDGKIKYSTSYLKDLKGLVCFEGYVENIKDPSKYEVRILLDGNEIISLPVFKEGENYKFKGFKRIKNLKYWYPRDLGESNLYDVSFILVKDGKEVYSETKKIGFRTIDILKEKDEDGESFIFVINGKKVFVKGANWIPADNILSFLKDQDYVKLLEMAYKANINMLRVWGGGIYEKEVFYETCDKLGILVWQDFMFSCGEYPDHLDWFRKLSNQEVIENVLKLRHHPSIIIWCGNNENNWAFEEWGFDLKVNNKNLGNTLYLEDFPKICVEKDNTRPYWPSSPYSGSGFKANSSRAGDTHVWNVWSGWQDYKLYEEDSSRFVSEFGFQAAPDIKTIEFFDKSEKREIFSDVMLNHNKQVEGMERLIRFISGRFGLPKNFESFVYLSQLNQAEAIKFGVEHWRSRKYKTAGTIYWQLNDSWPVFSWSAIDYFKRPKALYFYTKNFYSKILPILKQKGEKLFLFVVNDGKETIGELKLVIRDISGKIIFEKEYLSKLNEDSVVKIDEFNLKKELIEKSFAKIYLNVEGITYENHKILADLRKFKPENPEIKIEYLNGHAVITCKKPAIGVEVREAEKLYEKENFFVLFPGEKKTLDTKNVLQIKSLYDYL
ncbi:MAG: beta-mannosidase [Thermosipho sp. (in: thermotogales)]|nr:beta-mannosidase [Thermosipho sp. (in: thermotogales)]